MKIKQLLENLKIESLENASQENFASFVFHSLPNELAVTIGNSLRRILLGYVDGIAVTRVRISNGKETLKSEFVPLEGLLETPPYLILNLKNLIFAKQKVSTNQVEINSYKLSVTIVNDSANEYTVTGSDFHDETGTISVLNKELYIATVSPHSQLHLDVECKESWGFSRENEKKSFPEEGLISVDSNYNPVKSVSLKVDLVVVDLNRQEEQLTVGITTNGSLTPRVALSRALEIFHAINQSLIDNLSVEQPA